MSKIVKIPNIQNIIGNSISQSSNPIWPKARYSLESNPKFLFLLTPPYAGSTVLAKILNTASNSMILRKDAEGQWLVPEMVNDRWNPEKYIDWESVKSVWLSTYELINTHVEGLNLIIEKSPPNLLRAEQLHREFSNSSFLCFNRNPYANCSSSFHRHHRDRELSKDKRIIKIKKAAKKWLVLSKYLKDSIDQLNLAYFTYEQFCEETASCLQKVIDICPEIQSVDIEAEVQVKDYDKQGIVNQNQRQIELLDSEDIATISSVISEDEKLLKFFGYDVM